jgi:hypothetical protein
VLIPELLSQLCITSYAFRCNIYYKKGIISVRECRSTGSCKVVLRAFVVVLGGFGFSFGFSFSFGLGLDLDLVLVLELGFCV